MQELFERIDTLFARSAGCPSRTRWRGGRSLLVRLGRQQYELLIRSVSVPQENYFFRTASFYIIVSGTKALSVRMDALLKQYCRVLAAHDKPLCRIFRAISDQPVLIEHAYDHNGALQKKECRLFVTLRCNQRCVFCQNLDFNDHRTFQEVKGLLDDYCRKNRAHLSRTDLSITGGEPTVVPYLVPLVRYAKKKRFHEIILQTNAVLLSDRALTEALYTAGVDALFISFHSPQARRYDRLTSTKGQFCKAVEGIRIACTYPFKRIIFNMVLTKYNYTDVLSLVRFIQALPVSEGTTVGFFPSVLNENKAWGGLHVRYSKIVPYLIRAYRSAPELFTEFSGDCAFPVCIGGLVKKLPALRPYGRIRSRTIYVPVHGELSGEEDYARVKRTECARCVFDAACAGLPRPYARYYGVRELSPIEKSPGR